jgi:hypothetical protein
MIAAFPKFSSGQAPASRMKNPVQYEKPSQAPSNPRPSLPLFGGLSLIQNRHHQARQAK